MTELLLAKPSYVILPVPLIIPLIVADPFIVCAPELRIMARDIVVFELIVILPASVIRLPASVNVLVLIVIDAKLVSAVKSLFVEMRVLPEKTRSSPA